MNTKLESIAEEIEWQWEKFANGKNIAILGTQSTGKSGFYSYLKDKFSDNTSEADDTFAKQTGKMPVQSFRITIDREKYYIHEGDDYRGASTKDDSLGNKSWIKIIKNSDIVMFFFDANLFLKDLDYQNKVVELVFFIHAQIKVKFSDFFFPGKRNFPLFGPIIGIPKKAKIFLFGTHADELKANDKTEMNEKIKSLFTEKNEELTSTLKLICAAYNAPTDEIKKAQAKKDFGDLLKSIFYETK